MNKVELSITVTDRGVDGIIKGPANDVARAWYHLTNEVAESLARAHGTNPRDEIMALCSAVFRYIDDQNARK